MPASQVGEKRVLNLMELKLLTVVSLSVGAVIKLRPLEDLLVFLTADLFLAHFSHF